MKHATARRAGAAAGWRWVWRTSLSWRLLLLWTVLSLAPTLVVALPFWQGLRGLLDHAVHADDWARHLDGLVLADLVHGLGEGAPWLRGAGLAATLFALLLAPLLAGMMVAAGRAERTLSLNQLLQCGVIEYARMFRLALVALLPYGLALALVAALAAMADAQTARAVRESQAAWADRGAFALGALVLWLAHAWVESARAAFIADPLLGSAIRALLRGAAQLGARPFATLGAYLGPTVPAVIVALALGVLRLHVPPLGVGGFVLAFLCTQALVAVLGWGRFARLLALARVARPIARGSLR